VNRYRGVAELDLFVRRFLCFRRAVCGVFNKPVEKSVEKATLRYGKVKSIKGL
jgi:hypothetical protein